MKILVADDSLTTRKILGNSLKAMGHEVELAEGGVPALEIMKQPDAPQLLISDWQMPDMDGKTLCTKVRELPYQFPPYIIILTANQELDTIVSGLGCGANDFLTKPFHAEELRARIEAGQRTIELYHRLATQGGGQSTAAGNNGGFDRAAGIDLLRREIARAKHGKFVVSLGLMAVDGWSALKSQLSADDFSRMQKEITANARDALRPFDEVLPWENGTYLLVAPHISTTADMQLFETLQEKISKCGFTVATGTLSLKISIGEAHTDGETTPEQLLAQAAAALEQSRQNGGNCVTHV